MWLIVWQIGCDSAAESKEKSFFSGNKLTETSSTRFFYIPIIPSTLPVMYCKHSNNIYVEASLKTTIWCNLNIKIVIITCIG